MGDVVTMGSRWPAAPGALDEAPAAGAGDGFGAATWRAYALVLEAQVRALEAERASLRASERIGRLQELVAALEAEVGALAGGASFAVADGAIAADHADHAGLRVVGAAESNDVPPWPFGEEVVPDAAPAPAGFWAEAEAGRGRRRRVGRRRRGQER